MNSGIETILSPIEGDYEIIHDLNDFYQPGYQDGGLNDWDRKSGYFIKLNKQTQLPIYGYLTLDTDINFYEGWNLIPVLFDTEVDLPSYFGSQIDRVIIVRDAIGLEVYWPENNIATLENLQPGRSYLVKVSEDFALSCSPQPTQAWAGADQIDIPDTQTTLEGNIPEIGEGFWSIISGNGGNISEPTNPSSVFSGVVSEPYLLEWRISNECGVTADLVFISFEEEQTGFTCGDNFTDDRDGQSYETVLIGDQCWMSENLNIGEQIDGGGNMSDNGTIEKYCYDNLPSNCDTYGGLYQWDEMMDYSITPGSQGICPEGWHVPTDDEWKILEGTVDSMYPVGDPIWDNTGPRGFDAGKNLKSTTLWNNNGNGADLYNFTALPSGHMWAANGFILLGEVGFYFTSSKDVDIVIDRTMGAGSDQVYRWNSGIVNEARSVRCLKD